MSNVLEEHVSEADAATSVNVAEKLGFKNGDLIQEFGYDDDVDFDLRDDIEDLTGADCSTKTTTKWRTPSFSGGATATATSSTA